MFLISYISKLKVFEKLKKWPQKVSSSVEHFKI